ncbi:MAG: AMP-binding protein, partial [bacterium]|nr:AMP-binding protein [bacterium]
KFDMTWNCRENNGQLDVSVTYCAKLFKPETIQRLTGYFKTINAGLEANPTQKIAAIEMITADEKQLILETFNDTAAEYPEEKTLHQLFREQAKKTPTETAVIYETRQLTYDELNRKTNRLAETLKNMGVKPDNIVALEVERSLEMILAIMAVLKAGAAYLPISPGLPTARKNYMIKDSGAKILLRKRHPENKVEAPNNDIKIIDIDKDTIEPQNSPNSQNSLNSSKSLNSSNSFKSFNSNNSFNSCNSPNSLAYLIYTSGTTGKPKGVVIEHRSVVNLVEGLKAKVYHYEEPVRVSLVSPYIFDASVKQIFPALLLGHTLVVVPEEKRFDGDQLVKYYKEHKVTISDGTPVHLKLIISSRELGTEFPVKQFVVGGEALEREIVERVKERLSGDEIRIVNV